MPKILIVDDEEDIIRVLRFKLKAKGYEVVVAFDSILAVKEARQSKPDLILLDMMLPGGGGVATLRNVRLIADLRAVPVIVLTGMQDNGKKAEMEKLGVEGYIAKPYDFDKLLAQIVDLIGPTVAAEPIAAAR